MSETITRQDAAEGAGHDPRKRQQILDGAYQVFLERGFDAASMNDVAKAAGVSKGTLYVYFANKEELFIAIIRQEKRRNGDALFRLDPADHDVEKVLTRLGRAMVGFLTQDHVVQAMRSVIAISERMPELGKEFFEDSRCWASGLASYLRAQVEAGVLAIPDCDLAAVQFIDLAQSTVSRPLLYCAGAPAAQRCDAVVDSAVAMFLSAYRSS